MRAVAVRGPGRAHNAEFTGHRACEVVAETPGPGGRGLAALRATGRRRLRRRGFLSVLVAYITANRTGRRPEPIGRWKADQNWQGAGARETARRAGSRLVPSSVACQAWRV